MITPDLLRYVEQSLAAGKSKDKIKSELVLSGGWQANDVDEAFMTLDTSPYKKSTASKAGSFFMTSIIVILVLGALAFGAERFFGPVVSDIGKNIIAALPLKKSAETPAPVVQAPVDTTPIPVTPAVVETPQTPAATTPPPLVACTDNDTDCLIQSAAACSPATLKNTTTFAISTSKETSTRQYAIIGPENGQCSFTFSVTTDSIKKYQGKGAFCTVPSNTLVSTLNEWKIGNFYGAASANLATECTGSYFGN